MSKKRQRNVKSCFKKMTSNKRQKQLKKVKEMSKKRLKHLRNVK